MKVISMNSRLLKNTSKYVDKISSWRASLNNINNNDDDDINIIINNNNNNNSLKNNIHSPEVHDSKFNIKKIILQPT